MKEYKFKEVKGFEDVNNFTQFDQFEAQKMHGAKNRFVYDFSFKTKPGFPDNYVFEESSYTPFINLSYSGFGAFNQLVSQYGFPGDVVNTVSMEPQAENNQIRPYSWGNYSETVNEDEKTFEINEKTIAFLDAARVGTFSGQLANWVDVFRSGYVEFTIKTDKQNMIICSGSEEIKVDDLNAVFWIFGATLDNGSTVKSLVNGDTQAANGIIEIEDKKYLSQNLDKALFNLDIRLTNGKVGIDYQNKYDRNETSFNFVGNTNIADGKWHHVVVNFNRPGTVISPNVKLNKKNIEIWIDGSLDKEFDEIVNEYQVFYPNLVWLFNSPSKMVKEFSNSFDTENGFDYNPKMAKIPGAIVNWGQDFAGDSEFFDGRHFYKVALELPEIVKDAFKGSIHTYAHGINVPISKNEIQTRYRLWRKQTKKFHKAFTASAEIVMPKVETNFKKALKLYWEDLSLTGKNGVELDSSFVVDSYSVTHQTRNSKTEIFNLDIANKKQNEILQNVRVALTDNVVVLGPEKVASINYPESFSSNLNVGNDTPAQFAPVGNNGLLYKIFEGREFASIYFSGVAINAGDRILLTNQIEDSENGIWVYNGPGKQLTRPQDALVYDSSKNYIVYVTDGNFKNTYWHSKKYISSFNENQRWKLVNSGSPDYVSVDPDNLVRWKDFQGKNRFINLQDDINLEQYDLICFMNYPEKNEEIFSIFPNDPQALVLRQYNDFITSLKIAASNGASLMVTSPKLAEDLGIVKEFVQIDQEIENGDGRSSVVNPFQFDEPAERYFDTHRQNAYQLDTPVPGLTDKETWVLTEAINYIPKDEYDYEQWHLKYSYRQFGLQEGNEFLIPSLPLRQVATKDDLPGFRNNARKSIINAVAPENVLAGTVVTSLANNYYHGSDLTVNEYDDYATTIIVHNGQQLGGMPINGKIFVNCVEDAFTMSREDYNKAVIQVIPNNDPFETNATKQWQYSTSRLNRLPKRINVKELTPYGQTTPTNGGGGPLVQAATNSSNGIIRSETDRGNKDYQSDLYPQEVEEVYPLQEIPVLSMTWLGLQWLAGN